MLEAKLPEEAEEEPDIKEQYFLHLRIKSGDIEEYFTLRQEIIDLHLKKFYRRGLATGHDTLIDNFKAIGIKPETCSTLKRILGTKDYESPSDENSSDSYHMLRCSRLGVEDDKFTPSDKNYKLKLQAVIKSRIEQIMEAVDERALEKYSVHIIRKGDRPEPVEISYEEFERVQKEAEGIGFKPRKWMPEQIIDLYNL